MDSFKSLLNSIYLYKKGVTIALFGFLLLALPLLVFVLQQQQNTRQLALIPETVSLMPVADTYVDAVNPESSYGTSDVLKVDGGSVTNIAYLKFDLSSLEGKTITDAKLKIYVNNASTGNQILSDVNDNSWDESINFSTKPELGEQFANFGNTADNAFKVLNITDKVNMKKGQIFSLAVSTTSTNGLVFRSKEASRNKPTLVIAYTTPEPPTATISPTMPDTDITDAPISNPPPPSDSCASSAADIVIIIDKSLSMSQEIKQARIAARQFVDKVAQNVNNRVAYIAFDHGTQVTQLTDNFESVKNAISATKELTWGTCIQCAIDKANEEFSLRGRNGLNKSVVFLTDGRPTRTASGGASTEIAEEAAFQSVRTGHAAHGYNLFNIGLGRGVNTDYLQDTSLFTGGQYYFAPTPADLDEIYLKVATVIGKGIVTGKVFNDLNNNATMEASESGLPGWSVTLQELNGSYNQNATTQDENGNLYSFTGLCAGKTYRVNQTIQSGWRQTIPQNPEYYEFTINNGIQNESKDFGNVKITRCTDSIDNDSNGFMDRRDSSCHTDWNPDNSDSYDPTLAGENGTGESCADSKDNNSNGTIDGADPICHTDGNAENKQSYDPNLSEYNPNSDIILNLNVFLHGIGSSGDNRNPQSNFSNKNPLHPERKAIVEVYNGANQLTKTAEARILYASTSGSFIGSANVGKLDSDNYTIKIKTEQHLKNQFPGIQRISAGQELNLSPIAMVSGDVNNDNKLDILDYNILYGCYTSDLMPTPKNCDSSNAAKADLTDEGKVNLFDLNLFIRELSVQSGA